MENRYDVVIVGGGPGGLAAALTLGRSRKHTLLCDSGTPRNDAARHIHNFVTRDGTPPSEFRRIGRQQLGMYRNVEVRKEEVEAIGGGRGQFKVQVSTGILYTQRILLCTGMVDEIPDMPGYRELWGKSIFQCPYCHGWEIQDQRFAYLAANAEMVSFGLLLRGWARDVVVLTNALFSVSDETRAALSAGGVRLDERRISGLVPRSGHLERIEFEEGAPLARDVLFAHPRQRQVDLVQSLGLQLDAAGFVRVDEQHRETSIAGIHAGGDLVSSVQGALIAAASASLAAARLNHALTMEMLMRADASLATLPA